MSAFGDYLDEMDRIWTSDAEIERLLTGAPDVGEDLQPLTDLFAVLRAGGELADDAVAAYVAAAASSAETPVASPVDTPQRGWSLIPALRGRAATVTVATAVFLGGTSGLAVAADNAKPGDALYGIDRAFETIGIGAGAEQERLSEAAALVDSGEVDLGLQHAAETLEENESNGGAAAEALMDAATRVGHAGAAPSATTREGVAGLLTYISENVGDVDGARVAELARQIGGPEDRPKSAAPGPPALGRVDPPGLSDRDPVTPTETSTDPPRLSDKESGERDDVPANPPGLSDSKPGRPDPPGNQP